MMDDSAVLAVFVQLKYEFRTFAPTFINCVVFKNGIRIRCR